MSRQLAVTVVTPIKPAAAESLKGLLAAAGEDHSLCALDLSRRQAALHLITGRLDVWLCPMV